MSTATLVGSCISFHIAWVGPSNTGKSTFIDRWNALSTHGTLEAGGRLHQLKFVSDGRRMSFRSVVTGADGAPDNQTEDNNNNLDNTLRSAGMLTTSRRSSMRGADFAPSARDYDLLLGSDGGGAARAAGAAELKRRSSVVAFETAIAGRELESLENTATFESAELLARQQRHDAQRSDDDGDGSGEDATPDQPRSPLSPNTKRAPHLSRKSSVFIDVDESPPRPQPRRGSLGNSGSNFGPTLNALNLQRCSGGGGASMGSGAESDRAPSVGTGRRSVDGRGAAAAEPTVYSRVVRSTVVLPECASAAVHRMFLYDTPGALDRFSVPAALLSGKTLSSRLNGVVISVDGRVMQRDSLVADQVHVLIELCDKYGIAMLVIYRGAAIPDSFPRRGDARTMFIATDVDDFTQTSKAFTLFLSQLHAVELRARRQDAMRVELQKEQIVEHIRRPRQLVPTQKRLFIESGHRRRAEDDDDDDTGGGGGHAVRDEQPPIFVALIGAAASGKSTFLSALVDDFALSHYEPTTRLETGSCCLVSASEGWHRNIVLLEGPLDDVYAAAGGRPDIGIVFVDASSLGAVVEAAACVSEIENVHAALPPCLCVIVTKQAVDDFVSLDEVGAWAADLGAYCAGYVDPRDKRPAFFLSLMSSFLNDCELREQRAQRSVALNVRIPSATAPAVSIQQEHCARERVLVSELLAAANAVEEEMLSSSGESGEARTAALLRVTRQQRIMSLLRRASHSLPVATVRKTAEFETGQWARSVRQLFDRRDVGATGYVSVAEAADLLRAFDPAGEIDVARELRAACGPASSHVGFDLFCMLAAKVTRMQ